MLQAVSLMCSEAPVCKALKDSANHVLTLNKLFTNVVYNKA